MSKDSSITARLEEPIGAYQLFMLVLCLFVLGALLAEVTLNLSADTRQVLFYADTLICGIFLLDFVITLVQAPSKTRYMLTWGWIDLVSSLPMLGPLRWGRAARVLRILRLIRGVRSSRRLLRELIRQKQQSVFLSVSLISILLIFVGAVAILHLERSPDSNIQGAGDAVWWSFVTLTTVGYGDRYPVTAEGRAVAVMLMIAGLGVFGTFTACVANWFLAEDEAEIQAELQKLRAEVQNLQRLIIEQNGQANRSTEDQPRELPSPSDDP